MIKLFEHWSLGISSAEMLELNGYQHRYISVTLPKYLHMYVYLFRYILLFVLVYYILQMAIYNPFSRSNKLKYQKQKWLKDANAQY